MKKIIALLLLTVMCLSFAACSGKDEIIVGTWYCEEWNDTLVINEDGTGTFTINGKETQALTWTFDKASGLIVLTLDDGDLTQECTYLEESDTLYGDGITFVRVK